MGRLVNGRQENAVLMTVLNDIRAVAEHGLEKHGEPSLNQQRTMTNLKEELREVDMEVLNPDGIVNVGMERELRDLVAYGLVVLHRAELRRRGIPRDVAAKSKGMGTEKGKGSASGS
jgi:hypothetical protein